VVFSPVTETDPILRGLKVQIQSLLLVHSIQVTETDPILRGLKDEL